MRRVSLGLQTDSPTPAARPHSEQTEQRSHDKLTKLKAKLPFWTLKGLPPSWEATHHPLKRTRAAPFSRNSRERA